MATLTAQTTQGSLARRVARNMLSRSARHFVSGFVGFILIPMFTKHLGAEQYGVWVLAQSVIGYLMLLEFGLTTTLVRHVAAARGTGDYTQANRILGQLATLLWSVAGAIVLATLIGVGALPYVFKLSPEQVRLFQAAFFIIGTQAAMGVAMNIWEGTMGAVEDYHVLNGLYIFAALARLAYSVVLLKLGYGLLAILSAQYVVLAIVWLIEIAYFRSRYPQFSFRPQWHGWKEAKSLVKFSGAVFVSHIAGLLGNDTDKIIAGIFLGPSAVAIYHIGYKLYDLLRNIVGNAPTVIMPTAAALYAANENERLKRILCQVSSVMVGILGVTYLPLILYGGQFIHLWVGDKFDEAKWILAFLSISIFLGAHIRPLGPFLWGVGYYKVLVVATLTQSLLNVLLSIVLCILIGLKGIALSTFIVGICFTVFYTWYTVREFKVNIWNFFGRALSGALIGAGLGWMITNVIVSNLSLKLTWYSFFLQLLIFEIIFCFVTITLGFSAKDRIKLMQILIPSSWRS